jgi:hypothetical protein
VLAAAKGSAGLPFDIVCVTSRAPTARIEKPISDLNSRRTLQKNAFAGNRRNTTL